MSDKFQSDGNQDLLETLNDSLTNHDDVPVNKDRTNKKVSNASCGTVDEICTCVGFLTCQDPENYEVDDDDGIVEVPSPTPIISAVTLPDPPQPDPPESHNVLVQRTRNNADKSFAGSMIFHDSDSSRAPMESFDVIVHSPSQQQNQQQQQVDTEDIELNNNYEHYSTVSVTTTSTERRKRPEEYEPLILIVDDDELGDNTPLVSSPTSNCAVRDSSSTSSLQYHRRSPMFLSYASPQPDPKYDQSDPDQELKHSTTSTSHYKKRHDKFQSLLQHEISKRNGRGATIIQGSSTNTKAYSIQYNRYSTSKNHHRSMEDTIRRYSQTMRVTNEKIDKVDQYRYPNRSTSRSPGKNHNFLNPNPDISTIATSTLASDIDHDFVSPPMNMSANTRSNQQEMNDTDTVRAVAPDKGTIGIYDTDPNDNIDMDEERDELYVNSFHQDHHPIPTDLVVVPHLSSTKLS
jgi:hypothetical protein